AVHPSPRAFSLVPLSFFFNYPPSPEIYTLSLHDALPIFTLESIGPTVLGTLGVLVTLVAASTVWLFLTSPAVLATSAAGGTFSRSEEHTSELQSLTNLVCRLLLEKKTTHARVRDCA